MSTAAATPGPHDWWAPPTAPDHRATWGPPPLRTCVRHQAAGCDPYQPAAPAAGFRGSLAESSIAKLRSRVPPPPGPHAQSRGIRSLPLVAAPARPPPLPASRTDAESQPHPPPCKYTLSALIITSQFPSVAAGGHTTVFHSDARQRDTGARLTEPVEPVG